MVETATAQISVSGRDRESQDRLHRPKPRLSRWSKSLLRDLHLGSMKQDSGAPDAWVIEKNGQDIVGALSNVHMMYELDGKRLKACAAASWCVDAPYRGYSLFLMNTSLAQKGIDLWLNGSASSVTSRIMTAMAIPRIPSPEFDVSYFWITNREAFLAAALRKKKMPAASLLSRIAALGLWGLDLRSKLSRRTRAAVKRIMTFGSEVDAFWEKLRKGPTRLRAVRTSAALMWRFGSALQQNRAVVLGLLDGHQLRGYVVLREFDRSHLGLRQYVLADIQALDDSPDVLLDLTIAAIETTREAGMAALEWQGWNIHKREIAMSLHPRTYRYPVWPLYYKAINSGLVSTLTHDGVWDFSLFDSF
jgi:hypothetical protein